VVRVDGLAYCHACGETTPPPTDWRVSVTPPKPVRAPSPPATKRHRRETACFDYHDEAGRVAYTITRFDFENERGESCKEFLRSPRGAPSILYRLPDVVSAARQGWGVWTFEGEAKADLAALYARHEWGLDVAVTSHANWKAEFVRHFIGCAGATVFPDRDDVGRRKAATVARDLCAVGVPVVLRELPWHIATGGAS